MYFAYSADPRMRVNVGIRRRLAPLVDNNRRRIELLNSLLLSFPGTPILYYGDEIGMGDNIYLGDRNGVRTPMQWTSDRNAGFSRCDPARLYFPVIMDPIYGYQVVNVEAQLSDQSSLLHWTRNMIALRKLFQVFGRGTLTFLNPANRKVLAYLRDLERPDGSHETVLCCANLSRFAQPVSLDLAAFSGMEPVEMLGYVSFPGITESPYSLTLAPYSFLWLELQPASPKPEMAPQPEIELHEETAEDNSVALDLLTKGWSGWFAGHGLALLETALPVWLPRQRWFGAKTRAIHSIRLLDWIELPSAVAANTTIFPASDLPADSTVPPVLLFVEINYAQEGTDVYQLPLAFSTGTDTEKITASSPQSILATFTTPAGPAILHDASLREDVRQGLLTLIERNATLPLSTTRTAALEVAASLASAATGHTAREAITRGEAADLLQHPERATHDTATGTSVHLRPHEIFPVAAAETIAPNEKQSDPAPQPLTPGLPVAPVPISAQPGEAAAPPRSVTPASTSAAQRKQPRESPSAGDPTLQTGQLDARTSAIFTGNHIARQLHSRVITGEQSNTSIIYGQQFILKLFRRLQPGENPEVEIGRYLTEVVKFQHIAPFMGEIAITPGNGEKTTTAVLQGLVENERDGWTWFLDQFKSFFTRIASSPAPPEQPVPKLGSEVSPPSELRDLAGPALEAAALLGRRTAEMHLAFATPTDNPAFAATPVTRESLKQDTRRIDSQFTAAIEILKSRFTTFDESTGDAAIQLLSRRRDIATRLSGLAGIEPSGQLIRIHGDYHLGQTLRTEPSNGSGRGDFVLLDFEGEPARSLAERRQKQSPLKDVAGMLRSFSYASHSGLDQCINSNPEDSDRADTDRLARWALSWERSTVAEFLRGYRETIASRPDLLPASEQAQQLLNAYILEKALYEVVYELNNRPAWLRIPLAGILAL
jgi:maltose alpha-D-glucosyltransferase / alpha-amylase